jgi:hypothetical protein
LDDAVAAGYEFVQDPDSELRIGDGNDASQIAGVGTVVSRVVGQHEDGRPMKAYLMEIDQELYDQDQAEKARLLASVEKSGTTKGSFVLLKNTAQINQRIVMLQFSKVHRTCRGQRILVTLNKLSTKLPFIIRFLRRNSCFSLARFISLNTSFMLRNSSSSVE